MQEIFRQAVENYQGNLMLASTVIGMCPGENDGFVGGQLYHHLGILENATLITKSAEKYSAPKSTQLMLGGLFAIAGGMKFARTEEVNNGLSA